jgi:hypothetical protein
MSYNSKAIIALMMEAVRTYKTSVYLYVTTRRYIPEDSKLMRVLLSTYPLQPDTQA